MCDTFADVFGVGPDRDHAPTPLGVVVVPYYPRLDDIAGGVDDAGYAAELVREASFDLFALCERRAQLSVRALPHRQSLCVVCFPIGDNLTSCASWQAMLPILRTLHLQGNSDRQNTQNAGSSASQAGHIMSVTSWCVLQRDCRVGPYPTSRSWLTDILGSRVFGIEGHSSHGKFCSRCL